MSTLNTSDSVLQIKIDDILPNRYQPRQKFTEQSIKELALSIKEYGILNPLLVRKTNDKYELIAGERRWRAAKKIGLTSVPVIVKNISDSKMAEMALIENIQREKLTSIEEAKSFDQILKLTNMTQDELGQKLGKSQSSIANKLRLLSLPIEIQEAIENKQISERHARSLLTLNNPEKQKELLQKIINQKLTIKQLDEIISKETSVETHKELNISNIFDSVPIEKNNKKESDNMNNNMNNNMNFFPNNQNNNPTNAPTQQTNFEFPPTPPTTNNSNINPIPEFMPNNMPNNIQQPNNNQLNPNTTNPIMPPVEPLYQNNNQLNNSTVEPMANNFIQDVPLFSTNPSGPVESKEIVNSQPEINPLKDEILPPPPIFEQNNIGQPSQPSEISTQDNYTKTIDYLNKENIKYKKYSNETNKCIIIEF